MSLSDLPSDFDINNVLPILRSFGVSPDNLGPDRLQRLCAITERITDPENVTPEVAREVLDIFGINLHQQSAPRRNVRIGRNEACPCTSGKKYKKCCGQ